METSSHSLMVDIQITLQQGNTGDGVETSSQLLMDRRSHYITDFVFFTDKKVFSLTSPDNRLDKVSGRATSQESSEATRTSRGGECAGSAHRQRYRATQQESSEQAAGQSRRQRCVGGRATTDWS